MKRNLDLLGRLTLPKSYRDELKVKEGDEVDVDYKDNKIIVTNPRLNQIKTREEIEDKIERLKNEYEFGDNYLEDGFIAGLEWVLNDYGIDFSNNK